jgi:hypothetical protein
MSLHAIQTARSLRTLFRILRALDRDARRALAVPLPERRLAARPGYVG